MYLKLCLIILLTVFAVYAHAQQGLFDLSYDLPLQTANDILEEGGFFLYDSRGNVGEYRSQDNIYVSSILLMAEPEKKTLAGWLIKYSKENSADNDAYVLDTLQKMHGEKNHYDKDTEQLIWFLTDSRTVHVMYGESNDLILLYYDSRYPQLFGRK